VHQRGTNHNPQNQVGENPELKKLNSKDLFFKVKELKSRRKI
jgi:hypothetical protein